jgi:hypothetical protein
MFAKSPFTYFEITSYLTTFCKNNPRFFCNYKNTLFTCTLNFQKLHINTHELYTNKHILHTNKYMPSLQVIELSQPSPLKRISSRDSDERLLREEKQSPIKSGRKQSHQRRLMLMVKAVGV